MSDNEEFDEIHKQQNDEEEDDDGIALIDSSDPNYKVYSVFGTRFIIPNTFEIIEPLGAGAYGLVVAARDT